MKSSVKIGIALLALFLHQIVLFCNCSDVEVSTPSGRVIGVDDLTTRDGKVIYSFYSIPYAHAPVGKLRFKEPKPVEPWKDLFKATKNGSSCTQTKFQSDVRKGFSIAGQEDCLNLNVYSPKVDSTAKYPVMVFFHGGSFKFGSNKKTFYGPEFLLDANVVLVVVNYRLGVLGFMTTGDDLIPGNLGLKDQALALQWVHDNIENFGGNPNLVTVFGQSAGGASTHFHLVSPLSKHLVHRGISMSGTASCPWALTPQQLATDRTKAVAVLSGCPSNFSEEFFECMQTAPVEVLIEAAEKFQDTLLIPLTLFTPVIEPKSSQGAFLTSDPNEIESNIPWMTGVTSGEGGMLAAAIFSSGGKHEIDLKEQPTRLLPKILLLEKKFARKEIPEVTEQIQKFYFGDKPVDRNATQEFVDMVTDAWFSNGAVEAASKYAGDAYLYYYDYQHSVSFNDVFGKGIIKGASHVDDLLNLFPMSAMFHRVMPEADVKVSKEMVYLWTNFATYGNPTVNTTLKWEPSGKKSMANKYLHITSGELVQKENLLPERTAFWRLLGKRSAPQHENFVNSTTA